jgi:hypothetical protein
MNNDNDQVGEKNNSTTDPRILSLPFLQGTLDILYFELFLSGNSNAYLLEEVA